MNAVEQIIDVFGAGPASSSIAQFGAAVASESDAAEFASQISAAIQNSNASGQADSPWRLAQTPALEAYNATDFETLASIKSLTPEVAALLQGPQAVGTPEATNVEAQGIIPGFAEKIAATDTLQKEGIPGLQLVQLTGLELNSLVESGQLQPLNGGASQNQPAGNDLFLFAAGNPTDSSQPVRLIPVAQLEPFNNAAATQQLGAGEFVPTSEAKGPVQFAVNLAVPKAAAGENPAGLNANSSVPGTNTQATPNLETLAEVAKSASELSSAQAGTKLVTDKFDAKLADGALQAKADNKAVEGHMALAQTKQADAGQNKVISGQSQTAPTPQATGQLASAAAPATPTSQNNIAAQPKSRPSTAAEIQRAKQGGLLASRRDQAVAAARISLPAHWSTEQLAGLPETALLPDAVSGGLSGLRGEPGFMNSMGLTQGKPSTPLSGQVATQINLHVSKTAKNGSSEFSVRLNPTELGAVRVKMAFNDAGRVSAQLFAERPETLELLQREMRGIERAVEAGGHKIAQNGLSFQLDADDGQSAGKAFAEAAREDQLKDMAENGETTDGLADDEQNISDDLTDLAVLDQILSRVSPDTGLDVRV